MKSLPLAAAALLFGTSALAFAPSTEPAAAPAVAKDPFTVSAVETTAAVSQSAWTSEETPIAQTASAESWEDVDSQSGDPDLDLAVDPDAEGASPTGTSGPEEAVDIAPTESMAAADIAPAAADAAPAVTLASADMTPRPAAQNYPACRPGPGDDNCIQLYEPGVRVALASWTQPTGGLADGTATAMGGPYEPVDEASGMETAMVGDGIVDTDKGESPADEEIVGI